MTSLNAKGDIEVLAKASDWREEESIGITFPGLFAKFAKNHKEHYKFSDQQLREMLTKVSSKNRRNALENPLAQMPLDIKESGRIS